MKPDLSSGTRLGQYQVVDHLGAGGMGTVYRATDTKLGREVALKLLRPEMLEDATGLARFEREARALAALNHPNIAAIHGFEQQEGMPFLALEYVPGPTLAERLRRGPLPLREAVSVCKQIAEALEAAHARNIIHRDLKPANIKVAENGTVKVLDFGLAKSIERQRELSPEESTVTVAQNLTQTVAAVGTPAYMSPEQACGKELDSRTDIWSFGCVLYETLSGRQAFRGETLTELVAAIMEREPDWVALPANTPAALRVLLKRCLRKGSAARLRDIGDARIELEDLTGSSQAEATPAPGPMTRRTTISALAGISAGAAGAGLFAISRWRGETPRKLVRLGIRLPEGHVAEASMNKRVAISPDGSHVAYTTSASGQGQLVGAQKFHLRSLSELESRVLEVGGGTPFFSADGRWIGLFGAATGGRYQLRKVAISGGAPMTLCDVEAFAGGTWSADDTVYFVATNPGGVMRIPAAGGQEQEAAKIEFAKGERSHKFPCLAGNRALLFTVSTAQAETFNDTSISAVDTRTGQRKTLLEGGTHPRYSPSGHLVYARGGNLLAVRFDPDRLAILGQPFAALEGVVMSVNSGVANFDISASADLVYIPGVADRGERTLVWVDRNGEVQPLSGLPMRAYLHPRLSPDGKQLAIEVEGANHDFYTYDFERGVLTKMTTDGESHWPVWSPDGNRLAYRSGRMAHFRMWEMPVDRSRAAAQIPGEGIAQSAESWSPDGRSIVYTATTADAGGHIMVAPADGAHGAQPFVDVKAPAGSAKFSPDGHWLAYCSNESGRAQVYVQAFPGPGAKIQISNDGGTDPVWKRSGGELYFRDGDKMMAVDVSTGSTFRAERPYKLWEGRYSHGMSTSCGPPGATSSNYDVTADGKRFLMIKDEAPDKAFSKEIVVVLGWASELERIEKTSDGRRA